jgi:hypothetical protein
MIHFRSILAMAAFAAILGMPSQSNAAGCAVTASFTAPTPQIEYDPFHPAPQRSNAFSIALTAPPIVPGQPRVRSIDYQFLDVNSSAQPQIGENGALVEIVRSGRSILLARTAADYSNPDAFNSVTVPNGTNVGTGLVGFMVADSRQDLTAGQENERFDLAYRCNLADGTTSEGVVPAALLASVSTRYLVRATVVGGGSSRTLNIDPVSRVATGGMAIRSTGNFSLAVASANGLSLIPSGTTAGTILPDDQKIPYQVRIDGQIVETNSAPKLCRRSGLSGSVVRLSTSVSQGVNLDVVRAGTYSDVLTVTVTPEINGGASAPNCGA